MHINCLHCINLRHIIYPLRSDSVVATRCYPTIWKTHLRVPFLICYKNLCYKNLFLLCWPISFMQWSEMISLSRYQLYYFALSWILGPLHVFPISKMESSAIYTLCALTSSSGQTPVDVLLRRNDRRVAVTSSRFRPERQRCVSPGSEEAL